MNKQIFISIALAICAIFSSCNNDDVVNAVNQGKPRSDIQLSRSQKDIVDSQSHFAFKFFQKSSNVCRDTNMVVSPLSLSIDLAMLANGAGEQAYETIANALLLPQTNVSELNGLYKTLTSSLLDIDNQVELNLANSIWYDYNFTIKDNFIRDLSINYQTYCKSLDFSDSDNTQEEINRWANEKTSGKIKDIFYKTKLDKRSRFILCNALYFNGKWAHPFDKTKTTKKQFTNLDNTNVNVETMSGNIISDYVSTSDADVIRLPYGNEAFSMYIIVPSQKHGDIDFDLYIDKFDYDSWLNLKSYMEQYHVDLSMPKFKVSYLSGLIGLSGDLGLYPIMFYPDLSKMTDISIPQLMIEQYNTLEVSETGTQAASVSKIYASDASNIAKAITYNIDKPFMFLIEEKSTGAILFMGKVVKL